MDFTTTIATVTATRRRTAVRLGVGVGKLNEPLLQLCAVHQFEALARVADAI